MMERRELERAAEKLERMERAAARERQALAAPSDGDQAIAIKTCDKTMI